MSRYFIGVDAGGTQTRARLATKAGEIIGVGSAAGANSWSSARPGPRRGHRGRRGPHQQGRRAATVGWARMAGRRRGLRCLAGRQWHPGCAQGALLASSQLRPSRRWAMSNLPRSSWRARCSHTPLPSDVSYAPALQTCGPQRRSSRRPAGKPVVSPSPSLGTPAHLSPTLPWLACATRPPRPEAYAGDA